LQASLAFANHSHFGDKRAAGSSMREVAELLAGWANYEECLKAALENEEHSSDIVAGMAYAVGTGKKPEMPAKEALKRGAELARRNLKEGSVETSNSSSPSEHALQGIAAAYVRLGDLEAALKINDILKAIPWGFHSEVMPSALPAIASELVKAGNYQGALTTISKLPSRPDLAEFQRQWVLRLIFERQLKTEDLAGAIKIAVELTNRQQRANVLLAIASAQLKIGDRKGALERLEEIRKLSEPAPANEKKPAVAFVNAPVIGAVQAELEAMLGDFESAGKTAASLATAKDKAEALCAIAAQYLAARKLDEARNTLRRARRSAERITAESRGRRNSNQPRMSSDRSQILRRIADIQARSGDAEGALETVESLPSGEFLNGIVIGRAIAGDVKGAIGWLGILKNQEDKSIALESLAGMMTKMGDEAAALKLAGQQDEPLLKAYALLGIALAKAKQTINRDGSD
jgi:tetratricopeptide (TPR) repeat protein